MVGRESVATIAAFCHNALRTGGAFVPDSRVALLCRLI